MIFSRNFSFNSSHYNVTEIGNSDLYSSIDESVITFNEHVGSVFYPVTMVIGIIGNALVITVILKVKDMLNSTNIFLANLAIADIMVLLFWGFRKIGFINDFLLRAFNDEFWLFWFFINDTLINASVLTVLAIGFERYYAICRPLKTGYLCTKKRAFRINILAWILAALSCSPRLLMKHWDFDISPFYILSNTGVFFILPPIVLSVLFTLIVRHLRMAAAISANTAAIRHRRQVVRMLATVCICFFVLQTPYRCIKFFQYVSMWFELWLDSSKPKSWKYFNLTITFDMLLYLHSVVNPILYNLMSTRFREGFKSILCQ